MPTKIQGCCCSHSPLMASPQTCPAINPLTVGVSCCQPQTCPVDPVQLAKNKLLAYKQDLIVKHNAIMQKYKELCWNMKQKLLRKISDCLAKINYKKCNKCNQCCCYDCGTHCEVVDKRRDPCQQSPSNTHPLLDTFDRILDRRAQTWTNIRDTLANMLPMGI